MRKLLGAFLILVLFSLSSFAVTPIWLTGFEYGLAVPVTSGGGLFDTVSGGPAIQSSVKCSGGYALACNGVQYVVKNVDTAVPYLVGRFYFYLSATPASNEAFIFMAEAGTSYKYFMFYAYTDGKIYAAIQDGTGVAGPSITPGDWYRIDFRFYCGATTGTIDWRVEGVAQTQATGTITAGTQFTSTYIGDPWNSNGIIVYTDDVILSATSGDYPIGAGSVIGLRPNADGTHNNAANIMEDSSGNDIDGVTYFAYDKLDEDPWVTTANADYVRQTGNGAANYAEIEFANTTLGTINGAIAIMQYASATTTTNDGEARIRDSDGQETVIYNGDMSETSAFYRSIIISIPSGGWTYTHINALKARMGYSGDADPDPYWLGLIIEVDGYGTAAPPSYIPKVILIK